MVLHFLSEVMRTQEVLLHIKQYLFAWASKGQLQEMMLHSLSEVMRTQEVLLHIK
jgi:hypothetical protein